MIFGRNVWGGAGALRLGAVPHPHGPRAGALDPLRGRAEGRGAAGAAAPEEPHGDPGRCRDNATEGDGGPSRPSLKESQKKKVQNSDTYNL